MGLRRKEEEGGCYISNKKSIREVEIIKASCLIKLIARIK
jgi:hypothetical protein